MYCTVLNIIIISNRDAYQPIFFVAVDVVEQRVLHRTVLFNMHAQHNTTQHTSTQTTSRFKSIIALKVKIYHQQLSNLVILDEVVVVEKHPSKTFLVDGPIGSPF